MDCGENAFKHFFVCVCANFMNVVYVVFVFLVVPREHININ